MVVFWLECLVRREYLAQMLYNSSSSYGEGKKANTSVAKFYW